MSLDKQKFVAWMQSHAHRFSLGRCAMYVRLGLEAGGLDTSGHPVDARDYGPFLLGRGAIAVPAEGYVPEAADIAVFGENDFHKFGHIEVFVGAGWVSDFVQHHFSPYAENTPESTVYRFS